MLSAGISLKGTQIEQNRKKAKVIQSDNEELKGAKTLFDNKVKEGDKKLYRLNKDAKESYEKLDAAKR